jgi:hypothetical protein
MADEATPFADSGRATLQGISSKLDHYRFSGAVAFGRAA